MGVKNKGESESDSDKLCDVKITYTATGPHLNNSIITSTTALLQLVASVLHLIDSVTYKWSYAYYEG